MSQLARGNVIDYLMGLCLLFLLIFCDLVMNNDILIVIVLHYAIFYGKLFTVSSKHLYKYIAGFAISSIFQ